ncbi:DUF2087 domain-containing protein [Tumebacillus lipolyticus]|uniref:DUF2087 domain-containing protein n=1 Tax=Tumebacillus lipolyticus TaxID=1280370 RepID=A0ABW4ZY95_9BACL
MQVTDRFWSASLEEIKRGYVEEQDHYVCLLCGEKIEKGIVYPEAGVFYEAGRYIRLHVERAHRSVFEHLIRLDKKFTGLSDHQNGLLHLFYQGKSDREVQAEMGIGSASTIRNHRFALKEKERQARVFLAMMELLKEVGQQERQPPSASESEKILQKYFPDGTSGPLKTFALKEKQRLVVLQEIAKRFQPDHFYSEKEVNQILEPVYDDHVMIRRYLVEYGLLQRKPDGSQYWLESEPTTEEENGMNQSRREELKQLYKESKTEAGVYQIKNTKNQKVFLGSTMNLKTLNGKRFSLNMGTSVSNRGTFMSKELQEEWNEYGEGAFVIEVLEVLEQKEDPYFDAKDALEKLEQKWLDKLQPYEERGYNIKKESK